MKEKLVTGVLNRNSLVRDEHLKRNYGKYSQYTEELTPAIGEVYNIDFYRPLYDITNGQSLLNYTHNNLEPYGTSITNKYFRDREKEIIGYDDLTPDQIQAWGGKYLDYITYLDEVLGEDIYSRHVRYINDFLSGQYMENALRQTEVGVIRNINVPIARQGIITTNPNNLKGLDTPLGTITNYMYSTLLYNGAIFNSDRKSETKYLTPSLVNEYGNNLANVTELGDMLRVGTNDPRLREDLGNDVHIIHSFKDAVGDLNLKYLVNLVSEAKSYLSENNEGFSGYELGEDGYISSMEKVKNARNSKIFNSEYKLNTDKTYPIYNENDNKGNGYLNIDDGEDEDRINDSIDIDTLNVNHDDAAWEDYKSIAYTEESKSSILSKTAKLFNEHKINTLIGRFHTSVDGGIPTEQEFIDTAKSKYGNSHGRNLLTRKAQESEVTDAADNINGYGNPYCRTWTYHHQYNQVKKLIRPFITTDENGQETAMEIADVQKVSGIYRTRGKYVSDNGPKYLGDNTVLNKNGFVNICPSEDSDPKKKDGVSIHKCMFSIENLAWKDVPKFTKENYISKEQTGPNGGRIMWFPPYDLSFQENVNVGWNPNTFIGRGEKVYTYTDTERTGTLSFTLLIDHPSIVNSFAKLEDGDISSDIDSDILRYFAGCEIPNIKEPKEPETPVTPPETNETITEKNGSFSFYVYFPNNYSGMVTEKNPNPLQYIDYDEDWWKYILFGTNTVLNENYSNFWVGYEVTPNQGITKKYTDESVQTEIKNNWIGVSDCWWNTPGFNCIGSKDAYNENDAIDPIEGNVVDKQKGEWCFKYRVDKDLRQKLRFSTNPSFADGVSYQLNTLLDTENYQKDAGFTFGEVIAALIEANKLPQDNSDEMVDFLKSHGCDDNRIQSLKVIFGTSGLKITEIDIKGSADQNDKDNADMLAKRRAYSIKKLLTEYTKLDIDNKTDFTCGGEKANELPKEMAYDKKNKLNRYAFVTIYYTLPGARETLSNISDQATNEPEMTIEKEQRDQQMFNTWYEQMLAHTSIMQEYEDIFQNAEFEKTYETFKNEIKDWCVNNNISYNIDDYRSDDEWNSVINRLIISDNDDYHYFGYHYFIPAINIQYPGQLSDDFSEQFISQLNKHKPFNFNKAIQNEINSLEKDRDKAQKQSDKYKEKYNKAVEKQDELINEKEEKDYEGKITTCDIEIKRLNNEIEVVKQQINNLEYRLNHWDSSWGDRTGTKNQLAEKKRELSILESDKNKEIKKKDNYTEKLKDLNREIEEAEKLVQEYSDLRYNSTQEAREKADEIRELTDSMNQGLYLCLDRVLSEVYFQKRSENFHDDKDFLESLKGDGNNGESSDYTYHDYTGGTTSLFEIGIITEWDEFPFRNYGYHTDFIKETGEAKMSYNHLLREYLIIELIDELFNDKGMVEFAVDFLNKNDKDYANLKDLLFYRYLLSGDKCDKQDGWYISVSDTESVTEISNTCRNGGLTKGYISYYDSWMYIINSAGNGQTSINHRSFIDAVDEVSDAIETYRTTPTSSEFAKMMRVLKKHTANVLNYCETNIDDISNKMSKYANTEYANAEEAAREKAEAKETQRIKKQFKEECGTLKNMNQSLEEMRDQYLYALFVGSKEGKVRYETEAEYFQKLDIEHPLIFKSIKDKFKYFNPAFHSMSPEGFNARLNFLHQCTRQGHTYESTTNGIVTAHNLAFGRMPVCVLRIGDFINTRIIINNININYDNNGGVQWDLNPEGIGVQPMFAKVNLGITILGGQSLAGPISRLQNAVSFDYYANTGVYDNRADRYRVDQDGTVVFDNVFTISETDVDEKDYTLYRTNKSINANNNNSFIDNIKEKKALYDYAKTVNNGYKESGRGENCDQK